MLNTRLLQSALASQPDASLERKLRKALSGLDPEALYAAVATEAALVEERYNGVSQCPEWSLFHRALQTYHQALELGLDELEEFGNMSLDVGREMLLLACEADRLLSEFEASSSLELAS